MDTHLSALGDRQGVKISGCGRNTLFGSAAVVAVWLAVLLVAAPAMAARPVAGARYIGHSAAWVEGPEMNYGAASGTLRVSRTGRSVAPTTMRFGCANDEVRARLSGPSGRRSPVKVDAEGRFTAEGRRRAVLYKLRGRFRTRDLARIRYTARQVGSQRLLCKSSMRLYRNGVPPFSGCRTQRAFTHLWGDSGRVFQQFTAHGTSEFFTHVYACLFASPSKRFDLGQNYDEQHLNTFRLAGPFVAFIVQPGYAGWNQPVIEVVDLRDGTARLLKPQPGSWLHDLVLNANGSVAWTATQFATDPYGTPIGNPIDPIVVAREVWAVDSHGRRLLDSGPNLDLESLELNETTLTWIKDGITRTATLN